ncbi:flagellar export chaperone FliS [Paenibacillus polygoni]|uniref:Flagellar secretion chaperone FliS n=1 Tax=Paenibacillus polygoni TaxID=3050112 RepID=A0ABY8X147_9BACL|nr:flagellar export chaperone FliS [Paenibacillus polygoni]WIV18889.1 flagellar export chaperone FliS [Paenibacillus polygoni]
MIANPYEKYRQSSVQTSKPSQLVIMLYDGAIKFIKTALQELEIRNYDQVNSYFGKAQMIISELMSTLNHDITISKDLFSLYEYMNYSLVQANIKKCAEPASTTLILLIELRDTWIQASKIANAGIGNE